MLTLLIYCCISYLYHCLCKFGILMNPTWFGYNVYVMLNDVYNLTNTRISKQIKAEIQVRYYQAWPIYLYLNTLISYENVRRCLYIPLMSILGDFIQYIEINNSSIILKVNYFKNLEIMNDTMIKHFRLKNIL